MKRMIGVAFMAALALVLVAPAQIASAGDRDVIREGSCDGQSDWKLKVSPEDGGLEVEFEVDQNVTGDRWRVKIRHDGDLEFNRIRTTRGPERLVRGQDRRERRTRKRRLPRPRSKPFDRRGVRRVGDLLTRPRTREEPAGVVGRLLYH